MASGTRAQRFDALYAEHHAALFAFLLGRTSDRESAEDLLQELFVRAWRSGSSIDALPVERRRFWLYSVARNLVVDHYRARASRAVAEERAERLVQPEHARSAEAEHVASAELRQLDAAIWRLPDTLREPLVLQVVGDCSSAEIGAVLGQPAGTVRYHLAEARRRLAAELQQDQEDPR